MVLLQRAAWHHAATAPNPNEHSKEGTQNARLLFAGWTEELWKLKQLEATQFLYSHIWKEPHTYMVSSKPSLAQHTDSLLPCGDGGTTLRSPTQAPRCYLKSWWPLVRIPYSAAGGRRAVEQIPSSSSVQEQRPSSEVLKLGANPTSFLKNNHLFLGCWLPSPHPLCLQPPLGRTVDEGGKKVPPHFETVGVKKCLKLKSSAAFYLPSLQIPTHVRVGNLSRNLTFEKIPN